MRVLVRVFRIGVCIFTFFLPTRHFFFLFLVAQPSFAHYYHLCFVIKRVFGVMSVRLCVCVCVMIVFYRVNLRTVFCNNVKHKPSSPFVFV